MTQTLNITDSRNRQDDLVEDVARRGRRAHFAVLDRLRTSFLAVPAHEIERQVARAITQARASAKSSGTRPALKRILPREGGGDA